MSVGEFVRRVEESGIKLVLDGDTLKVRGPKRLLTPELLETLKARKAEVLAWLRQVPAPAEATCYDCAHFRPARGENPREAWGFCRHLGKGRFGVAQACSSFQAAARRRPGNTLARPEIAPPRASHEVSFSAAGGPEAAVTCSCGCPAWDVGRDGRPYCWACLAAQRMTH